MEAKFYLEIPEYNNKNTKRKRSHQGRAKLVFVFFAVSLSALLPYVSLTAETKVLSPIKPWHQLLRIYPLCVAITLAFVKVKETPTISQIHQRKRN